MSKTQKASDIIRMLESKNFYAECPCCQEPISLREVGLFYLDRFTAEAEVLYQRRLKELKEQAESLKKLRKSISVRSEMGAKAVNIGFILERLAPSMKTFRFEHNDCRSLFDPIDYLIFEGLALKRKITRILFVDIKTGGARLNSTQKEIKELVERKKVKWDTYSPEV